jgi:hypothetical protein
MMQLFRVDFRQLDRLEGAFLPRPAPVRPAPGRRVLPQGERAVLVSALEFGKRFSPALGPLLEIVNFGVKPPALSVLRPLAMPVGFAVSKSTYLTIADALTASAFAGIGAVVSGGVYGSTTREIGVFATGGGGIFTNFGLSAGGEYTFILGTPADFAGPYFGIGVGVSGPPPIGVGGMLLFSPTLSPTMPITLTLMGFSVSVTVNTPSPIPVTVTAEVTNTKIWPVLRF